MFVISGFVARNRTIVKRVKDAALAPIYFLFAGEDGERCPALGAFSDPGVLRLAAREWGSRSGQQATWEEFFLGAPEAPFENSGTIYAWLAVWPDSPVIANAHLSRETAMEWIRRSPLSESGYTASVLTLVSFRLNEFDRGHPVTTKAT